MPNLHRQYRTPALALILAASLLQSADPATQLRTWGKTMTTGLKSTVTAPDNRNVWLLTGLGTAVALPLDKWAMARREKIMPASVANLGDEWGGRWGALTLLPGIYLADTWRGRSSDERRDHLQFALNSVLAVGGLTALFKEAVGRERPNHARRRVSFPSGHVSLAFCVAEVIRTQYGNPAAVPFYTLAVITGLSRIHDNKHYPSDVIAGAGLAIATVRGFDLARRDALDPVALQVVWIPGRLQLRFQL